jgi:hypothetical protein
MNLKSIAKLAIGTTVVGACMFSAMTEQKPTQEEKIQTEMYDKAARALDFKSKNEYLATQIMQKMDSDSIKALQKLENKGIKELKKVVK